MRCNGRLTLTALIIAIVALPLLTTAYPSSRLDTVSPTGLSLRIYSGDTITGFATLRINGALWHALPRLRTAKIANTLDSLTRLTTLVVPMDSALSRANGQIYIQYRQIRDLELLTQNYERELDKREAEAKLMEANAKDCQMALKNYVKEYERLNRQNKTLLIGGGVTVTALGVTALILALRR